MQKDVTFWWCPGCNVVGKYAVPYVVQSGIEEFCDECGEDIEYVPPWELPDEDD